MIYFWILLGTIVISGISSLITWKVINWITHRKIIKMGRCPYKNACMHYDKNETRAAIQRVSKLLIANIEDEETYKQNLYKFMTENHRDMIGK